MDKDKFDEEKLIKALREALTYSGEDRPALVARIPVICNDIREIRNAQEAAVKSSEELTKWLRNVSFGLFTAPIAAAVTWGVYSQKVEQSAKNIDTLLQYIQKDHGV